MLYIICYMAFVISYVVYVMQYVLHAILPYVMCCVLCVMLLYVMLCCVVSCCAVLYTHPCIYPPTPAGAAPRSSVHVCSPLSTTRPLPFLQIAIGPRLPHPFYCSGISPPPPGTRRSHSAVLGTTSRPRLLDPFHLSGISMVVGTPRHSSAPQTVYFSGIAMVVE